MSPRECVRAIVFTGDKMLAMKRYKSGQLYYTLVGGAVDPGEDRETAVRRELQEETGLVVGAIRLVFIEEGREVYGPQYVYLCEYKGGDPVLDPAAYEVHLNAVGQNTYQPLWLSVSDIAHVPFRSAALAQALLKAQRSGFPKTPRTLAWKPEPVTE